MQLRGEIQTKQKKKKLHFYKEESLFRIRIAQRQENRLNSIQIARPFSKTKKETSSYKSPFQLYPLFLPAGSRLKRDRDSGYSTQTFSLFFFF